MIEDEKKYKIFRFSLEIEPWMGQEILIHPDAQKLIGKAPLVPNTPGQNIQTYEILEVRGFSLISPTFQSVLRKAGSGRKNVGLWDIGPLWHFLNSEDTTAGEILHSMQDSGGMLLFGTEPQEDKQGFLSTPRFLLHGTDIVVCRWCCGRNPRDDTPSTEGKVLPSDLFVFVAH